MGRHDTVAWQRIIALCTIYGVDINDIKKKSKKILSLYSDLVVLKRAKEDEFSFLYPCPPLDYMKALDILDKLDPDQGKHDLSIRTQIGLRLLMITLSQPNQVTFRMAMA